MRLDELLARLDIVAHQLFEGVGNRGRVFDVDTQQHALVGIHSRFPQLVGVHLAQALEAADLDVGPHPLHLLVALGVAVDPSHLLALFDLVERRLSHVDVLALDELGEIAEEEGEQQRADVAAVDVGVSHGHDAVIANLLDVEVVAHACPHRGDEVADLV